MKFKLDENLPVSSARSLAKSGDDVDTVAAEGLTGAADPDVVAAAAAEERVLITLDRGLGDPRAAGEPERGCPEISSQALGLSSR